MVISLRFHDDDDDDGDAYIVYCCRWMMYEDDIFNVDSDPKLLCLSDSRKLMC